MNLKRLINTRGLNFWVISSAAGLNVMWGIALMLIFLGPLNREDGVSGGTQVLALAAAFIGPLLIALISAKVAGDGRGPSYGTLGSIGCALVTLIFFLPAGITGLMMVAATLLGGLNGGLLSLPRSR